MESWAAQGGFGGVIFVCVSVDDNVRVARQAALSFGTKLRLRSVVHCVALQQPRQGQLGCSGFTILRPADACVLLPATPAYLQYGPNAHRSVCVV